jgi:hypothetical protein
MRQDLPTGTFVLTDIEGSTRLLEEVGRRWGQYHASGIPDLESLQTVVQVCTIALAGVAAAVPREKGPVELAALTAALLAAFELCLTHWSYLTSPADRHVHRGPVA